MAARSRCRSGCFSVFRLRKMTKEISQWRNDIGNHSD